MSFNRKSRKLRAAAAVVLLMGTGAHCEAAQTTTQSSQKQQAAPVKALPASVDEEARLKQYLDKDGRYKDSFGGHYDPKAGTYTDEKGGILDNWVGYTYKDGSYKSKLGDYWDAPTHTFKLANGETLKADSTTSADAIKVLRDSVEENGGYDKDFIRKAMMGQIGREHPPGPPSADGPRKPGATKK